MKKQLDIILCLFLIWTLIVSLSGCQTEQSAPTPTDANTVTSKTSSNPEPAPLTFGEPVTEITEDGIVIATDWYTVTLPNIWNGQYITNFYSDSQGYTVRFREKGSYEQQGHGGHVFTISIAKAMEDELTPLGGTNQYYGGLYVPQQGLFSVTTFHPTDVQFTQAQAQLYYQLTDTVPTIMASFTPTEENMIFFPVGKNTFEKRASYVIHKDTGNEVMDCFMADTGVKANYIGIALDYMIDKDLEVSLYDYGFHLYKDTDTHVYYLIPFESIAGTQPKVYKADLATYPYVECIWDKGAETVMYHQFVNQLNDPDDTKYYVHDIDGNGIKELLLLEKGTALTIYQYQKGKSQPVEVMNQDFQTGTLRLFVSDQPEDYPGLFVFTVGGGYHQYQYITLENSQPVQKLIWEESISDDFEDKEHLDNSYLLNEAKDVVENNRDVPWLTIP